MQTEQRPDQLQASSSSALHSNQPVLKDIAVSSTPKQPARLPVHSRAAAAQRLSDMPERPTRGAYYPVPHHLEQPTGWRTRRHVKRKNLRQSNMQYAAVDRIGTQWAM